jgi:two-component system OmpR family sensor kinase
MGRLLLIHQDQGKHTTFYRSPEMKALPLAGRLEAEPWKNQPVPWFESYQGAHGPIRVFSLPYQTRTGRQGVIRVVEDMGEIVPILVSFRRTLMLLLPIGLGLAAIGGYWLSGRAMAPVERVTAMSRAIEASSLHQRLPHPGVDCEIGRLVDTLNHMLGRLDASFTSMARFTADASHELRSPLANLRSLVDVSLRDPHSREELLEDIQSIGEEVDRLGRIVEDLLLMAKADADRLPLRLEELRLDELAESQVEAFAGRAEEAGLRLHMIYSAPARVVADEHWIHQLIENLLDNAVKFTPGGGTVTLAVHSETAGIRLVVEDTGPGIPPDDLPRIFERFYRCRSSLAHAQVPGTGLGLAIAHWIAKAHGASLQAANRPAGGSRFEALFPPAP